MEIADLFTPYAPYYLFLFGGTLGGIVLTNAFFGRESFENKFGKIEQGIITPIVGLLFESLLVPVVYIALWSKIGINILTVSTLLFTFPVLGVLYDLIYEKRGADALRKVAKSYLKKSLYAFLLVVALIGSITASLVLCPKYISELVFPTWTSFFAQSMFGFLSFLTITILIWTFVLQFSSRNFEIALRRNTLSHCIFAIVFLTIGLFIAPINTSLGLVTPKLTVTNEVFSEEQSYSGDWTEALVLNTTRYWNSFLTNFTFYGLMETCYRIDVPKLKAVSFQWVIIDNPSNTSFRIFENPYSSPLSYNVRPSLPSTMNGFNILTVDVPANVSYRPVLFDPNDKNSKMLSVIIDFRNFAEDQSFWVNLTYWQQIDIPKVVSIRNPQIQIQDLGNGTWLETHTLMISNPTDSNIWMPLVEYDWFSRSYVIRNSTLVYVNGNLQFGRDLISDQQLGLSCYAYAHQTTNLTFTFLNTENPKW